jgi:hypothetical protein
VFELEHSLFKWRLWLRLVLLQIVSQMVVAVLELLLLELVLIPEPWSRIGQHHCNEQGQEKPLEHHHGFLSKNCLGIHI